MYSIQQDLTELESANALLIFAPAPQRNLQRDLQKKLANYFSSINANHSQCLDCDALEEFHPHLQSKLTELRKELTNPQNKDLNFLENHQTQIYQIEDIVFCDE